MKIRMMMVEAEGDVETLKAVGSLLGEVLGGPHSAIEGAAGHLRERGHHVERAPGVVPGLWLFNGREITEGQLLSIANGEG